MSFCSIREVDICVMCHVFLGGIFMRIEFDGGAYFNIQVKAAVHWSGEHSVPYRSAPITREIPNSFAMNAGPRGTIMTVAVIQCRPAAEKLADGASPHNYLLN